MTATEGKQTCLRVVYSIYCHDEWRDLRRYSLSSFDIRTWSCSQILNLMISQGHSMEAHYHALEVPPKTGNMKQDTTRDDGRSRKLDLRQEKLYTLKQVQTVYYSRRHRL